jgi:hypothetical protein
MDCCEQVAGLVAIKHEQVVALEKQVANLKIDLELCQNELGRCREKRSSTFPGSTHERDDAALISVSHIEKMLDQKFDKLIAEMR